MKKNLSIIATLTLISMVLLACGNGAPRKPINELASHIELVSVNFADGGWKLRLTHRQKDDRISNQLACGLHTQKGHSLAFERISIPDMSYQLTETIDIPSLPSSKTILDELPEKMAYQLDCQLFSENFATEWITKKSTMHKIPGVKASYR